MIRKSILFYLIFAVLPTIGFTQNLFHFFEKKDIWDGLPSDVVYAFCEDQAGQIWIGTNSGLCLFNGHNIKQVFLCRDESSSTVFNPDVRAMFCDSKGRIWVGTNASGLFFKEANDVCFKIPHDSHDHEFFPDALIFDIVEDKQGRIWLGTLNHGLLIYDPESRKVVEFGGKSSTYPYPSESISGLLFDESDKTIWATTSDYKLLHFSNTENLSYQTYPIPLSDPISSFDWGDKICQDDSGNIWMILARAKLLKFEKATQSWTAFEKSNNPNFPTSGDILDDIDFDPKSRSIIISISKKGVCFYNTETKASRLLNGNSGVSMNYTIENPQTVFITRNNDFYVGGFKDGFVYSFASTINASLAPIFHAEERSVKKEKILSLLSLDNDNVLVGTDEEGLYSYSVSRNSFEKIPLFNKQGKPINVIKSIFKDRYGKIWMGHWLDGMTEWDTKRNAKTQHVFKSPPPFSLLDKYNCIWGFTEDLDSNLWVLSLRSGAICYKNNGTESEVFDENNGMKGLGAGQCLDIHCDKAGNIWVATERQGCFVKKRGKANFEHFLFDPETPNSLSSNSCTFIFEDPDGQIWVGTNNYGLNCYQPSSNTFRHITSNNGLYSNTLLSMVADAHNDLWVVSNTGFTRLRKLNGEYTPDFRYIPPFKNQYSHLAAMAVNGGNVLLIGGQNGLTVLEIPTDAQKNAPPKVVISDVIIQGKGDAPIDLDSVISTLNSLSKLSFDKNDGFLELNLATSNLNETNFTEFAYTLEGFEKQWHYLKNGENTLTYIGLPDGDYKLKLKAKAIYSDWGDEKIITLHVHCPFWQASWFKTLAIVLVVLMIVGFILLAQYHARAQEKSKILEQENNVLEQEKRKLSYEVDDSRAELMAQSAEMVMHKELLTEVKQSLKNLSTSTTSGSDNLRKLVRTLEKGLEKEEDWDMFRVYFDQRNQDFSQRLIQNYPNLTKNDIKHCMLIKLNLGSHDIAKLLNITLYGVQKSRFRLKRKLSLGKDEDLIAFLEHF